jgi:hypothetical protein
MKIIILLDRIWSLWLVSFAHSSPNFIFWLGRLIFSVSINSHPDNIYRTYWPKLKGCNCLIIFCNTGKMLKINLNFIKIKKNKKCFRILKFYEIFWIFFYIWENFEILCNFGKFVEIQWRKKTNVFQKSIVFFQVNIWFF